MPQYAVIATHPPDNCPLTNKSVRKFYKKNWPQLPKLAQKMGVTIMTAVHLDPNHKAFILFEAPNAESVRDLLVQTGMMHFLEIDFHLVTPLQALFDNMDDMPTIF